MARIAWVEDRDASGETFELYARLQKTSTRANVPDILRTICLRPDFPTAIDHASEMHFSDGASAGRVRYPP